MQCSVSGLPDRQADIRETFETGQNKRILAQLRGVDESDVRLELPGPTARGVRAFIKGEPTQVHFLYVTDRTSSKAQPGTGRNAIYRAFGVVAREELKRLGMCFSRDDFNRRREHSPERP